MDDCRFDNWTRMVAEQTDRRSAVKGIAGGVAALAALARAQVGLAQDADVILEANCKGSGGKCKNNRDCCSKNCKKGKCECSGQGKSCKRDQGCCSGRCNGSKCDCGSQGDLCKNDGDCCSRNCKNNHCKCVKQGDRCKSNKDCCSKSCNTKGFCDR